MKVMLTYFAEENRLRTIFDRNDYLFTLVGTPEQVLDEVGVELDSIEYSSVGQGYRYFTGGESGSGGPGVPYEIDYVVDLEVVLRPNTVYSELDTWVEVSPKWLGLMVTIGGRALKEGQILNFPLELST